MADIDRLAAGLAKAICADSRRRAQPGRHQPPDATSGRKAGLAGRRGQGHARSPDLLAPDYSPLYNGWLNVAEVLGRRAADAVYRPVAVHCRPARPSIGESGSRRSTAKSSTCARGHLRRVRHRGVAKSWPRQNGNWAEKHPTIVPRERGLSAENRKLMQIRGELDKAWTPNLFLWQKSKDDLLKEMD